MRGVGCGDQFSFFFSSTREDFSALLLQESRNTITSKVFSYVKPCCQCDTVTGMTLYVTQIQNAKVQGVQEVQDQVHTEIMGFRYTSKIPISRRSECKLQSLKCLESYLPGITLLSRLFRSGVSCQVERLRHKKIVIFYLTFFKSHSSPTHTTPLASPQKSEPS